MRFLEAHSLMIFDAEFYVVYSLILTALAYALAISAGWGGVNLLREFLGQEFKARTTH